MIKNDISAEVIQILTPQQAWHYKVLPKSLEGLMFTLYVGETQHTLPKDEIQLLTGYKVNFENVPDVELTTALSRYYRRDQAKNSNKAFQIQSELADDFLIKLVNEAQEQDSSDIHIESYESKGRIRFRIDGLLVERYTISKEDYPSLVNKIKIKSNLDISEKRLPQDGRFLLKSGTQKLDLRVSILPTMFLLNSDIYSLDITKCGFDEEQLQIYQKAVLRPNGIILISGPTGSGKTTTLYSTLKLLNKSERNIVTIEDPIEYTLDGVNQVQLKESIGLTFPKALRTFLRQDPDIIMVGEIRDRETAEMAIRASLTGHLVLSTIHTRSALGTINRLIDMGVPSFLIADTLNLSVAQRLVRLLCNGCKVENDAIESDFSYLFHSNGYKLP
jgi:type IV pilus assembly protein PilB